MDLRYIALHINYDSGFVDPFRDNFNLHSRFISNYLSVQVRKLKFKTDNTFRMICVTPSIKSLYQYQKIVNNVLDVHIPFDKEKYDQLKEIEKYEYYLHLLEEGYNICSKHKNIPLSGLLSLHKQFRDGGYKNEWLHKKKRFKELNLEVILYCYFTSKDFRLKITINNLKTKEELISGFVIRTLPDEVCFQPLFKDVVIIDNILGITDSHDYPRFTFKLEDIYSNKFRFEINYDSGLVYKPLL